MAQYDVVIIGGGPGGYNAGIRASAVMLALVFGVGLYAVFTWAWTPTHYIHLMLVTLLATIAVALAINRLMGGTARLRHRAAAANMA